jgi:hypothetical protein
MAGAWPGGTGHCCEVTRAQAFMAHQANGNGGRVSGENAGIAAPGNFVAGRSRHAADRSHRPGFCGIPGTQDPGAARDAPRRPEWLGVSGVAAVPDVVPSF